PDETRFTVFIGGIEYATFRTPLAGEFNVRNCLGVITAAEVLGLERRAVAEALATFKSVKRRMQVRGEVNGVTVIDDFAHHPTAVRETLRALAQRYPNRRLVAVFEPRTWASRKKVFQDDYARAFDPAGYIVIAALYEAY